jgi:hypothetical protein
MKTILLFLLTGMISISVYAQSKRTTPVPQPPLPEPYATKSVRNMSMVIGWPDDKTPVLLQDLR